MTLVYVISGNIIVILINTDPPISQCERWLECICATTVTVLKENLCIIKVNFYKQRGKSELTQVCTFSLSVLSQLCSALVNNSHPSDSDSAWPRTIFYLRVQFHLTGCILPLMHLTVACSILSSLYPVSADLAVVSTISFCISNTSHHSLFLLSLFTVCYSNSLSICAYKLLSLAPSS